jgi:Ni/Fe-hydrogenase subunit HybB-like protein
VVQLGDLLMRDMVLQTMVASLSSAWWWLEIGLLLTAIALFATPEVRNRERGLFLAALATVVAVIVHRTGVAVVGLSVPEYGRYVPKWSEVLITAGIVSLGLLAFRAAIAFLPIYQADGQHAPAGAPAPQASTSFPMAAAGAAR